MAIIMDYYKGGTRIIVHDDFRCTKEEEGRILKRIEEIAIRAIYLQGPTYNQNCCDSVGDVE